TQASCLSLHDALPIFENLNLGQAMEEIQQQLVEGFAGGTVAAAPAFAGGFLNLGPLLLALGLDPFPLAAERRHHDRLQERQDVRSEEHTSELQSLAYL